MTRHIDNVRIGGLVSHGWELHRNDIQWERLGSHRPTCSTTYTKLIATALKHDAFLRNTWKKEHVGVRFIICSLKVPSLRIVVHKEKGEGYQIVTAFPIKKGHWSPADTRGQTSFCGKLFNDQGEIIEPFPSSIRFHQPKTPSFSIQEMEQQTRLSKDDFERGFRNAFAAYDQQDAKKQKEDQNTKNAHIPCMTLVQPVFAVTPIPVCIAYPIIVQLVTLSSFSFDTFVILA